MDSPQALLLTFFAITAFVAVAIRIRNSFWFVNNFRMSPKELMEDILKQLYHVEQGAQSASLSAMAGALKMSDKKLVRLVEELSKQKLIKIENHILRLTEEGRVYALNIVRSHRLWEKFLSENTGFDKSEWHQLAEQKEHNLSHEDANRLSERLGNPRFDPHGDPIPTEVGEITTPDWKPLPSYKVGTLVKIVHLEDEPKTIYDQLVDEKLHIGSRVHINRVDNNEIEFYSEGETHSLSPIVASSIHTLPLTEDELEEEGVVRLSSLQRGETAKIVGISSECRGASRRRLLDLGFVFGSLIEVELESPLKEPKAYSIRNTVIALRDSQSELVLIEKV